MALTLGDNGYVNLFLAHYSLINRLLVIVSLSNELYGFLTYWDRGMADKIPCMVVIIFNGSNNTFRIMDLYAQTVSDGMSSVYNL